jgi:tellurite resistance protein
MRHPRDGGLCDSETVTRVTKNDRFRFERARKRGQRDASRPTAVVRGRYDAARDSLELTLRTAMFV